MSAIYRNTASMQTFRQQVKQAKDGNSVRGDIVTHSEIKTALLGLDADKDLTTEERTALVEQAIERMGDNQGFGVKELMTNYIHEQGIKKSLSEGSLNVDSTLRSHLRVYDKLEDLNIDLGGAVADLMDATSIAPGKGGEIEFGDATKAELDSMQESIAAVVDGLENGVIASIEETIQAAMAKGSDISVTKADMKEVQA